jgi:hypothetical protein
VLARSLRSLEVGAELVIDLVLTPLAWLVALGLCVCLGATVAFGLYIAVTGEVGAGLVTAFFCGIPFIAFVRAFVLPLVDY